MSKLSLLIYRTTNPSTLHIQIKQLCSLPSLCLSIGVSCLPDSVACLGLLAMEMWSARQTVYQGNQQPVHALSVDIKHHFVFCISTLSASAPALIAGPRIPSLPVDWLYMSGNCCNKLHTQRRHAVVYNFFKERNGLCLQFKACSSGEYTLGYRCLETIA